MAEKTKQCKHCQEEINAKAKRCPKCQGDLRSWFRRHPILTGIAGFFLLIVVIGAAGSGSGDSKSTSTKETNENPPQDITVQEEVQEEAPTFDMSLPRFGDGTHRVGEDIQSGTYRTREGSSNCYYARLSGFSGELDEILSNENTSAPAVVTIRETDAGFQSRGCGTWTQDITQTTESTTSFNDGMFIIGTDIEPGTYRNTGQSGCYYARLSGFTGDLSTIISNDNVDEQTIVTIAASDKGFKSNRCGTWEKIE